MLPVPFIKIVPLKNSYGGNDEYHHNLYHKIKEVSSDISVPGMLVRPYNRQDFGGIH